MQDCKDLFELKNVTGVSGPTSVAAIVPSSGAAATQTTSSLVVASSNGTTSAVSTTVSTAPKLPYEITGKTVEEVLYKIAALFFLC
ncbi:hypothetical protein FEM48_Zijuj08G0061200 [Ziziphus jujuba var. spinosa]|uniref:Uncharacterized protein n=1 Tax=Ziziphus jujuba var. spinosa TaxID=714518 RepID=A0A978UXE9_ZIZJJ|nr:hypothetical protein FEM48_Zijuj08G0061200 [Ziziphus jujuba var. spinosa]